MPGRCHVRVMLVTWPRRKPCSTSRWPSPWPRPCAMMRRPRDDTISSVVEAALAEHIRRELIRAEGLAAIQEEYEEMGRYPTPEEEAAAEARVAEEERGSSAEAREPRSPGRRAASGGCRMSDDRASMTAAPSSPSATAELGSLERHLKRVAAGPDSRPDRGRGPGCAQASHPGPADARAAWMRVSPVHAPHHHVPGRASFWPASGTADVVDAFVALAGRAGRSGHRDRRPG